MTRLAKEAQDGAGSIYHSINGHPHDGVTLLADENGVYLICSKDQTVWRISAELLPISRDQFERLQAANPELFGIG